MAKQITIHKKEIESKEGIYLVDPKWVHLDEDEVRKSLENHQKIFKINFEEIK